MAPIKFEEQLKDKLEKRTMSPSAESWAKLSDRLDAEDKKNKRPIYWWLSIAAMFIVMIAITVQVFNKDEGTSVSPTIVNEEPQEIKINEDALINDRDEIQLTSEDKVEEALTIEREEIKAPQKSNHQKQIVTSPKTEAELAVNTQPDKNKVEEIIPTDLNDVITNIPELDKTAIAEAIDNLNTANEAKLNREVDSLLKVASKELTKNNALKDASKTVDANTLLDEVQDEMGQSFRSKVYEVLKDSYKTVKTAVAQRNN